MRTIVATFTLLLVLIIPAPLLATNLTVKAAGGGNFTTIQACASAMSNGDTCTVFAGTYNENVTVGAGGVSSYKTLTVNSGDTVNVLSFTINSHVKVIGFHVQNPASPNLNPCFSPVANSTDYFITNNVMASCAQFIREPASANTTHGFIQGNTMSYSCSTPGTPNVCRAVTINGDYHLIENNDVYHVSDGFYVFGAHNVLRKNTFHDVDVSECGSIDPGCHIDFMQADSVSVTQPPQFLLIEGNIVRNMVGSNTHALGILQAETCGGNCFNAIIRFHVASHIGGGGIVDDNSQVTPSPPNSKGWYNVKAYNNSWIDVNNQNTGNGNGTNGFDHGSFGGADINDLFYYTAALVDFNAYFSQDTNNGTSSPANTGPPPFAFGHNLGFCTTDGINLASPCNLRSHVYGTGSFTSDSGNIISNPLFVNYAGNDFHLQSGSPALGAGTNLTTVASGCSGSTTSITLAAGGAGFFNADSTIPTVQADRIRVGSLITSPVVQLSSINYSTDVATFAPAISCNNGDGVFLYSGSDGITQLLAALPDIGGLQFTGSPVASFNPASLSVNFFNQFLSTTSSIPQVVVLTNTGTATLTISSAVLGGTNAANFGNSTTCGASLGAGNSCNYSFTFTPSALGPRSAVFTITDNAPGSPHVITLTGTGVHQISGVGTIKGTGTIKVSP